VKNARFFYVDVTFILQTKLEFPMRLNIASAVKPAQLAFLKSPFTLRRNYVEAKLKKAET
jgi:hypothetical protein